MKIFNEDLFNKLSEYDYKDLNHMDDVKSFEDFIKIMNSFGVEFDESDIEVLKSISESDSVDNLRLKLSELGLEVSDDDLKEVLTKLDEKEKSASRESGCLLSDEDLSNISGGGYSKVGLFVVGVLTCALAGVAVGSVGYGSYKIVKKVKNTVNERKK